MSNEQKVTIEETVDSGPEKKKIALPEGFQEELIDFLEGAKNPWTMINTLRKKGAKGLGLSFLTVASVAVINFILLAIGLFRHFTSDVGMPSFKVLGVMLVVGLAATYWTLMKTYGYLMVEGIGVLYEKLGPVLKVASDTVLDKVRNVFNGKADLTDSNLKSTVHVGKMVAQTFGKMPGVMKWLIAFVINRIPFVGLIKDMELDLFNDDDEKVNQELFNKADTYVREEVLEANNLRFILWLLPLSIIVQMIVMNLKF